MEIRQLEALLAISDHGSFSDAAAALGTVQSNISSRIAKLEAELGTELVDRSSGKLTESGKIVSERSRRVVVEVNAITSDVSELTKDVRGQVSLGMIGTAGRWVVPLLLEAQRRDYPHIALRITEGTNSTLEPRVVDGTIDMAVLGWPASAPELKDFDLYSEDLAVIAHHTHPLAAQKEAITLKELSQHELLLPLSGTPIRKEIDDACRIAGVQLKPIVELDGIRTIASMTFDGYGPSILPITMLSKFLRESFRAIPISDISQRRVILVSRRFGFPSAPVRAVEAMLHQVTRSNPNTPSGVYVDTPKSLQ